MFGSIIGNILGISYFLIFQILGITITLRIIRRGRVAFSILIGSLLGTFALQWLPILFSFLFSFTKLSHVFALLVFFLITAIVFTYTMRKGYTYYYETFDLKSFIKSNLVIFILIPLYILVCVILYKETIPMIDGSLHCGQSTYGDMNMHLGFITSIAKQHTFPPEYSIHPGTKIAYPFLSDSISSSIYIWGSSLKLAYLLPMYFALIHVFCGMYSFSKYLLGRLKVATPAKACLAFILFFFNGGFGFWYFIKKGFFDESFTRIFTEFYKTPTNYLDVNIQWHNIICDMLIPQRATLFGWAVLFPLLALILQARKEKSIKKFVLSGIFAGGLVLIHTHSFLALAVICSIFLLHDLKSNILKRKLRKGFFVDDEFSYWRRFIPLFIYLIGMTYISQYLITHDADEISNVSFESPIFLFIGLTIVLVFLVIFIYNLIRGYSKGILLTWGLMLAIVLILSLPQLLGFTLQQAQGNQFTRGVFNWINEKDNYIFFYIKNLGIMFFLTILVFLTGSKRQIKILSPGLFLFIICEFIVFQPNNYDNNKLMLVAYAFFCIAVADYIIDIPKKLKNINIRPLRIAIITGVTILASFSAILTIGREFVSDYELYSKDNVAAAKWIEKNTNPKSTFLSFNNHNNSISSLTGRNIVCGSGTFLYYHGIDYVQREADIKTMYENPQERKNLLNKYKVNYIYLGDYERANYTIPDYDSLLKEYEIVYNKNSIVILKVS